MNNHVTKIEYKKIYSDNKSYFDYNYVPQQSNSHGGMLTIQNLVSDFTSANDIGNLATKYRVDQHEFGITHEWYHWLKPLKNLINSVLIHNLSTVLISSFIFYVLGWLLLDNGKISVFAYLFFFMLNNLAFLVTNTKEIFSYHLAKTLCFLTNNYPKYNSIINKKEAIHVSQINNSLINTHVFQKVLPYFLLSIFSGIAFMSFINFICSIQYTSFKNYIWVAIIVFPFTNFHQFGIVFWKSYFKTFFSKSVYKI